MKFFWRSIAVIMMIGAVIFIVQIPGKVSYGDQMFQSLGLPVWSQGTEGWHYPVLVGMGAALGAMILYAVTTRDRLKTFRHFMEGVLLISVISWVLMGVI